MAKRKLTKKEKIALVRWYYGSTIKDAKKYVEEQDNENVYDSMLLFMETQGRLAFLED